MLLPKANANANATALLPVMPVAYDPAVTIYYVLSIQIVRRYMHDLGSR